MPYKIYKKDGYKVCKPGAKKCFSKKGLSKAKAEAQQKALYASEQANESLNPVSVGSKLQFKSVIPTADESEATVMYKVKREKNTDLFLVYKLGATAEDADYLYGAVFDHYNPKGRPQKFEDPSAEDTVKMLSVHNLTPDDIEMAGQDAYERIAEHIGRVPKLDEPYEESLKFEELCSKILSE